ncbi:DNA replication/repair protein RecF [Penaeicola halotolerans]|uniref:DNA replication/repair protein RecF n=1 Tax=Penaeicola halotolerans TaxID=2793196 RepID=UPI001CF8CABC|nr:DNA replication/repair protein RecF [Penaeicola halotolerans]
MHLENISLTHFKNYASQEVAFSPQINCFVGPNGSGKTNLLDAIYYLCLTKSAFNAVDMQNIQHEADFFTIRSSAVKADKSYKLACIQEQGKKKQVSNNGKAYDRVSEHIGEFPCVLIAPDDTQLIKEGSEERRKFFDGILSQLDRVYLDQLMQYGHYLKQRNALLKQFAERQYIEQDLLDSYNSQLFRLGRLIYERRREFILSFIPIFEKHYAMLSDDKEQVGVRYESDVAAADFEQAFRQSQRKDLILKRTTMGVHKDEFVFEIDGFPIKKFGSQGQQKSFLIALKLAQFEILAAEKGTKPLLLLDDIFDKLDDQRIAKLLELVAAQTFGQIFVTDARPERSREILASIEAEVRFFEIQSGRVALIN